MLLIWAFAKVPAKSPETVATALYRQSIVRRRLMSVLRISFLQRTILLTKAGQGVCAEVQACETKNGTSK